MIPTPRPEGSVLPTCGEYTIAPQPGLLKGSYLKGLRATPPALAEPGEAATMAGVRNPPTGTIMRLAFALMFALCLAGFARAEQFSSLEERMSQSEFHAAGLDKLSPDELKSLNTWLQAHYGTQTTYVTPSGQPVFYPQDSAREAFDAHIVGEFTGWYGQSVFTLDNGQKWKQAESGSRQCGKSENPEVRIKPTLMGSWLMYVKGCSDSVRVERTK